MRRVSFLFISIVFMTCTVVADVTWDVCSPLCKKMAVMNYEMKVYIEPALSRPENNGQTLIHIRKMKDAAMGARGMVPKKVKGNDPEIEAFRNAIDGLIAKITAMEMAVEEGNNFLAQKILILIQEDRDAGHQRFRNAPVP